MNDGSVVFAYASKNDLISGIQDVDLEVAIYPSSSSLTSTPSLFKELATMKIVDNTSAISDIDVADLSGGGFVVKWLRNSASTADTGLYVQTFNSVAEPTSNRIKINADLDPLDERLRFTGTTGHGDSSLTSLSGGRFAVSWVKQTNRVVSIFGNDKGVLSLFNARGVRVVADSMFFYI